jgi:hypothetical protein
LLRIFPCVTRTPFGVPLDPIRKWGVSNYFFFGVMLEVLLLRHISRVDILRERFKRGWCSRGVLLETLLNRKKGAPWIRT